MAENFHKRGITETLEEDGKYFFTSGAVHAVSGREIAGVDGIYIIDEDGRKFMDFHGNSVHQLGYNNPYLVDAMKKQLSQLSFSPRRYSNRTATALAKS